jgi:hypothetical protein
MYLFKNYAVRDWIGFAEVYGMPLPVGRHEPKPGKADWEALIQAVHSLGSDASYIGHPDLLGCLERRFYGIDWLMISTLWLKYLCNQRVNARANISAINSPFDRLIF